MLLVEPVRTCRALPRRLGLAVELLVVAGVELTA